MRLAIDLVDQPMGYSRVTLDVVSTQFATKSSGVALWLKLLLISVKGRKLRRGSGGNVGAYTFMRIFLCWNFFEVIKRTEKLAALIQTHLNDNRRGEILRSGVKLVIFGAPNAGKSSLLNYLGKFVALLPSLKR